MIKISVVQLGNEGEELIGSEPKALLEVEDSDFITFTDDLKYNLRVSLVDKSVLVAGSTSIAVKIQCGRCLDYFKVNITNHEICRFYEEPGIELDITEDIREDLLVVLPNNYVCDKNCKGLCPTCCINLNKDDCDCPEIDNSEDIWSELDKLNC